MNKIYVKFLLIPIFLVSDCLADHPGVDVVNQLYTYRQGDYIVAPDDKIIPGHTTKLNHVLKNTPDNVRASKEQKKVILKSVMASVFIHGNNLSLNIQPEAISENEDIRSHFTILQHTENLAKQFVALIDQANCGYAVDTDIILEKTRIDSEEFDKILLDLKKLGGIEKEDFKQWFGEV